MPFAVTHVLITIIVIELIRDYFIKDKEHFPLYFVLIGGVAGLLPDIDFLVYWFMSFFVSVPLMSVHRTISHSLIWPIFTLMGTYWGMFKKNQKIVYLCIVLTIGLLLHLLLDMITGQIPLLSPFYNHYIGLDLLSEGELAITISMGIDAILLVLWLGYVELRHKLSSFI